MVYEERLNELENNANYEQTTEWVDFIHKNKNKNKILDSRFVTRTIQFVGGCTSSSGVVTIENWQGLTRNILFKQEFIIKTILYFDLLTFSPQIYREIFHSIRNCWNPVPYPDLFRFCKFCRKRLIVLSDGSSVRWASSSSSDETSWVIAIGFLEFLTPGRKHPEGLFSTFSCSPNRLEESSEGGEEAVAERIGS